MLNCQPSNTSVQLQQKVHRTQRWQLTCCSSGQNNFSRLSPPLNPTKTCRYFVFYMYFVTVRRWWSLSRSDLLGVELELASLEDVAVAAAALAGPAGDARVQAARVELLLQRRVHLAGLLTRLVLGLGRPLGGQHGFLLRRLDRRETGPFSSFKDRFFGCY